MTIKRRLATKVMMALPILAFVSMLPVGAVATTYTYDALNRLTAVDYDNCDIVAYAYDAAGNMTAIATTISTATQGDFNANGKEDIADAILAMQIAIGLKPSLSIDNRCRDASGDGRIGMEDVIYTLQMVAEIR